MKINRRDYLKRLGAAGVLVGVTGLEGFALEHGYPQTSCPALCPQPGPLVWEPIWCEEFPSNAGGSYVKLIFEGLIGIAPRRLPNRKVVCDIGFHRKGDPPIHHHLSISAYSNAVNENNCGENIIPDQPQIKKIALEVPHPEIDQTFFYQRGRARTRKELSCDEDFRWIVDFESDYLYQKHPSAGSYLQKKKDVYRPVLTVPNGIFYTLRKTASTFQVRTGNPAYDSDLGNVADIIGANIYVASGTGVNLIVNNVPFTIRAPGEIYFKNHCMQKGTANGKCEFDPRHTDKKKRSDFFLNYKAFERNGAPEYELYLKDRHRQTKTPDVICEKKRFVDRSEYEKMINDESPCSAAGYGGESKGFPGSS